MNRCIFDSYRFFLIIFVHHILSCVVYKSQKDIHFFNINFFLFVFQKLVICYWWPTGAFVPPVKSRKCLLREEISKEKCDQF
jgi:hypothetical protein